MSSCSEVVHGLWGSPFALAALHQWHTIGNSQERTKGEHSDGIMKGGPKLCILPHAGVGIVRVEN